MLSTQRTINNQSSSATAHDLRRRLEQVRSVKKQVSVPPTGHDRLTMIFALGVARGETEGCL
jgi:hypothetical protein